MVCVSHYNNPACVGHTVGACSAHNAAVCSGHTTTACASHNVSVCPTHVNSCSSHSGYIAPVAAAVFTDSTLSTSINIKATHFNELRTAISQELTRRSKAWPVDPGAVLTGDDITSTKIKQLRNGLNAALTWSYPTYLSDANTATTETVESQQYTAMRTQVNAIKAVCVCNCNYACTCQCNYACTCQCNYACTCQCNYACTCNCNYACTCQCNYACTCNCNYCPCNCNYCPCNCNYCPCNCNYCPCNCNYACVCNCNYSDERLKTDIIYM